MARKLWIYFENALAPERTTLQARIRESGFKLTVDEAYAPMATVGYLPCTLDGEDAGVDVRFEADGDWPDSALALASERGTRAALLRLSWGGDPREALSAYVLAAAFAQAAQGLVLDPDAGQLVTREALLKKAQALLGEM